MFPVQVGLLGSKQVQVILAAVGVPLPGITAKFGAPVIGQGVTFAIAPDVELTQRAGRILRSLKPRMLGGGVVKHHIHHDTDAALVGLCHQVFEVGHGAVGRIDGAVIGDVVAIIDLGRDIDRRQPDGIDAQLLQIVQPLSYPCQIAIAVTGAVLEALRIDLINNAVLPPGNYIAHKKIPFSLNR
ncbi:hypothetical protein D3C79_339800 [compost metagenome]